MPRSFPIAALGASAGGLQALTAFFEAVEALDAAPGMAFIVLPHLKPDEKSRMAELLQQRTRLPVEEVFEPMRLEPDRVYVLPADRRLTLVEDRVEPRPREETEPPHPVDDLFAELGPRYGARAVGIVLSGMGANGSAGVGAIKENGGLVLAQTQATAEFADMPRHAAETGLVDQVMAPEEMPAALVAYAGRLDRIDGPPNAPDAQAEPAYPDATRHAADEAEAAGEDAAPAGDAEAPPPPGEEAYAAILRILRRHAGLDFREYKQGTVRRRIERRVALHRLTDWTDYVELLRESQDERDALGADLLITVTSFFRDPASWEALREAAIRPLVERHSEDEPLRAWIPGCASGEEAYTLGMLLFEEMEAQNRSLALEIFATDASAAAIERARHARYPAAAVQHLDEARVRRFFKREDDTVYARHDLREAVVFAQHDLIHDPPFSSVDLLICRNVLIYMRQDLQRKLIRLFDFSLRGGGCLFLGPAEHVGETDRLFEPVSQKHRLFRRRSGASANPAEFPIARGRVSLPAFEPSEHDGPEPEAEPPRRRGAPGHSGVAQRTARALAAMFGPPAVLVQRDLTALYYHGAVDAFLRAPSGEPTQDLSALLRDSLGNRLRRLAERVEAEGKPVSAHVRLGTDGGARRVRLEVAPVDEGDEGPLLVSFHEEGAAAPAEDLPAEEPSSREAELESEVMQLRDDLRRVLDRARSGAEELKSYNEEVTSMNEELRSTNEELETSKEELQSLNEELNTVNAQLRAKVDQLHERTSDLDNLLRSTDVATLFLDANLNIRWFAPGLSDLFSIRVSDTGRPISDLVPRFDDPNFLGDAKGVLQRLTPSERHVQAHDERWYLRRILPYRTLDDRIDGVVVTFTDVSEIKNARDYAEKIVATVPLPFVVLDGELRVLSANAAFYETFRVAPEETERRLIYDLGNGQWNIPELRRLLEDVLPHDEVFTGYRVSHRFETVGEKVMRLNGRRLDHVQLILLAIEDVTEEAHAQQRIERNEERLRALVDATSYVIFRMSPDWSRMWALDGADAKLSDASDPDETWLERYVHPDDRDVAREKIREAIRDKEVFELEHRMLQTDGSTAWMVARAVPLLGPDGEIREWFGAASDVTARRRAEEERELLLGELNHRVKNLFAVIRALASQGDTGRTAKAFRDAFLSRLDALIDAHNLALGGGWQGSDLAALAQRCLEPYQGRGAQGRIEIEGEFVRLDARETVSVSLVLHELATNAVKHGSLSVEGGSVRLAWSVSPAQKGDGSGREVSLAWEERDGPRVTPPQSMSFGLKMIERVFDFDLGGSGKLDFRPDGLRLDARFVLPAHG